MIANHDRSGWFGASDVDYIIGNRKTKSFEKWWLTKLGLDDTQLNTVPVIAGTYKEHQILDFCNIPEKDEQILIEDLRLRVNLDGNSDDTIFEVKTHKYNGKPFKVPIKYKRQVWVQMYAKQIRKAYIIAYAMQQEDYLNFFLDIDNSRLEYIPIDYNEKFINEIFLPNLIELKECLVKGVFPY